MGGKLARAQVFRGSKEKTASGHTKDQLFKNKRGKIVSKKASAAGRKSFANIRTWFECVNAARKALNLRGFVAINGKKAEGKALYAKAKALYAERIEPTFHMGGGASPWLDLVMSGRM